MRTKFVHLVNGQPLSQGRKPFMSERPQLSIRRASSAQEGAVVVERSARRCRENCCGDASADSVFASAAPGRRNRYQAPERQHQKKLQSFDPKPERGSVLRADSSQLILPTPYRVGSAQGAALRRTLSAAQRRPAPSRLPPSLRSRSATDHCCGFATQPSAARHCYHASPARITNRRRALLA